MTGQTRRQRSSEYTRSQLWYFLRFVELFFFLVGFLVIGEAVSRIQSDTSTAKQAQNIMNAVDDVNLGAPYRNKEIVFTSRATMYVYGCQDRPSVACPLPGCSADDLVICLCVPCTVEIEGQVVEGGECVKSCQNEHYSKPVRGAVTIRGTAQLRVQAAEYEGVESIVLAEVGE